MLVSVPRVKRRQRTKEGSPMAPCEVQFKEVRVYLVEMKMGSSRRSFLTQLARSKGFCVDHALSDEVTHVVSEDIQPMALWAWLRGCGLKTLLGMQVLDISWFTDCMREGRPVPVEARHCIQDITPTSREWPTPALATVSQYACQRRTTTENHNAIFTDALEILAESSEFSEMEGACLAFRRAASLLKSLPRAVSCVEATQGLPCLGEHTKAVMEEIIRYGCSSEVQRVLSDERYQTLKRFTSVFGVGPKTAWKWHGRGLRSLKEVLDEPTIELNRMQRAGFRHHGDISEAVSAAEARALGTIVDEALRSIQPDAVLTLTGGFRRGKELGHDVDFLLTTPELGKEKDLIVRVIDQLRHRGILLYVDYQASTFEETNLPCRRFEAMDHFEKAFLILRLEERRVAGGLRRAQGDARGWRAVRVDLVATPVDRYAFALLGWSGSRQFERDLRRFARQERNMLLDNHALYDKTKNQFLPAKDEEEIFAHLGLDYMEPWQRNA